MSYLRPCPLCGKKLIEPKCSSCRECYRKKCKDPTNHPWYGRKHLQVSKDKIGSKAKSRGKLSEEHKVKIGLAGIGRKHSEESKRKMSVNNPRAMLGKHLSEETKRKIGRKSKEYLANNPHPMQGKHHTEEAKRKIGLAFKGKPSYIRTEETKYQIPLKVGNYQKKPKKA